MRFACVPISRAKKSPSCEGLWVVGGVLPRYYGLATPGFAHVPEALAQTVVSAPGPRGVKVELPVRVLSVVVVVQALPGDAATVMLDMKAATAEFM